MDPVIIEKIKEEVRNCFIARNKGTIDEKISYCMSKGMPEDKARHAIIQIVKNLSGYLLPLRDEPADYDIHEGELIVSNALIIKETFTEWPRKDVEITEEDQE